MTASIYDKADRWRRRQTSWFYFELLKAPRPYSTQIYAADSLGKLITIVFAPHLCDPKS